MNTGPIKGSSAYNFRKSTVQKDKNPRGTSVSTPPQPRPVSASSSIGRPSASRPGMPHQPHPTSCRGDSEQAPNVPSDTGHAIISELRNMFADFKTEINNKLDHVISDLNAVKTDIATVKSTMQDLEGSVADTSARIQSVEAEKIPELQRQLNQMKAEFEDKLIQQELHHRKQNLLFYGIVSHPNENVYQEAAKAFAHLLEISTEEAMKIPVVNIHRLPTKSTPIGATNAPEPPDPIIVRFARMSDRDNLLRAFEQPRRPRNATEKSPARVRITVRTDLPPRMKRERGRLASIAYNFRKTKNLKTKIAVRGAKVVLMTKHPNEPSSAWSTWSD
ncbi:uncharacterized protein [Diadema antillarum]|uniref:uncharacterized protein n=1 Tax=Diadema antillarum TaxID=105358 RepID=UPI003A88B99A